MWTFLRIEACFLVLPQNCYDPNEVDSPDENLIFLEAPYMKHGILGLRRYWNILELEAIHTQLCTRDGKNGAI